MATDGAWQVKPLLAIVPGLHEALDKGMELDGKLALDATACGTVTDSTMPRIVDAHEAGRRPLLASLTCCLTRSAKSTATYAVDLNLGKGKSHATINNLTLTIKDNIKAKVEHPDISVGVNNIMQSQLAAAFDIRVGETEANIDSMMVSLGEL